MDSENEGWTGEWTGNYFNYFTEIEEQFQRARGSALFLLSPLDWALIEHWKNSGVPLPAVLEGIDAAFEKWRSRKRRTRMVNSLAYCAQAVADAAQRASSPRPNAQTCPFDAEELRGHIARCSDELRKREEQAFREIAASLDGLEINTRQVEDLERRLTALEDKMVAAARSLQTDAALYAMRESLDRELGPYRGKMTADQLSMLERRYLDSALLEQSRLPRLSLFYLR